MGFWTKKARKRGTKKKGGATDMVQPLVFIWRPQPDLNRCCRRERPVSWTRLDDGDVKHFLACLVVPSVGFGPVLSRRKVGMSWTGLDDRDAIGKNHLVGRAGFEPTTLCLKGRYSAT